MREFIASLPMFVQLGLIPVIGAIVGGTYALLARGDTRSHRFGLTISSGVAGAAVGGFLSKNYITTALAALVVTWLVDRLARKRRHGNCNS